MSDYKLYQADEEALSAGDFRYAVVAARFNHEIVDALLEGALEALKQGGAGGDQVSVLRVPGAVEIPLACQRFAAAGRADAVIALGCVIRGDTPHFDYVCAESARGITEVSLKYNLPVIYGILTVDNRRQAETRAQRGGGDNKGADAARAAMETLAVYRDARL